MHPVHRIPQSPECGVYRETSIGGDQMAVTDKQFQGFIRLALGWLEKALEESPENKSLLALKDIFQSMLEDD